MDLDDPALPAAERAAKVEQIVQKHVTDAMSATLNRLDDISSLIGGIRSHLAARDYVSAHVLIESLFTTARAMEITAKGLVRVSVEHAARKPLK